MLHCLSPHPTSVITLFFKYTATTDIYTLSLHDALPIFIADARNFQILAVAKISATTRETRTVVAAVPADADALPLLPLGNTVAQFIDDARDFMPWNARILNSGPRALFREHVTVADAAGLHLDEHVSCAWLRNLSLDNLEIGSRLRNLGHLHWCDCDSCSCHNASLGTLKRGVGKHSSTDALTAAEKLFD